MKLLINLVKFILSVFYLVFYLSWRFLFFIKLIPQKKFEVKIISVGNIGAGGTGKTPMVQLLSQGLSKQNISHCIVSRGYKKKVKGLTIVSNNNKIISNIESSGDEPFMLAKALPGTPVIVGNKSDAIKIAINKFNPQFILLDDGFQSLRIKRDYNLVLIDLSKSINNYKILPIGYLREPLFCLKRANIVVYTKTNYNTKNSHYIKNIITKNLNPNTAVYESNFVNSIKKYSFVNQAFENHNIKEPKFFVGCSGISNNNLFKQMVLEKWTSKNVFLSFSNHHNYSLNDIQNIKQKLNQTKESVLITTKKDFYKIYNEFKNYNLFILDLEHKIENTDILINSFNDGF